MHLGRYMWAAFWTPYNLIPVALAVGAHFLHLPGLVVWCALEALYLGGMIATPGFRALVDGKAALRAAAEQESNLLMELRGDAQRQFRELKRNCEAILAHVGRSAPEMVDLQREELSKLASIYLQLLLARQTIQKATSTEPRPLAQQIAGIDEELAEQAIEADVRQSLQEQRAILLERQKAEEQAGRKLAFINSELARIEQQVKLLREQSAVRTAPGQVGEKISQVVATLRGTSQWIDEQRELLPGAAVQITLNAER